MATEKERDDKPEQRSHDALNELGGSGARLADFSIRYPVTICMVFVSLLTIGLIALAKIPLVMMPDVDQPFLNIWVPYPNATPGQVQESITKPLEEALSTVPGVERMSSRSEADSASVRLHLRFDQDVNAIRSQVREKIDQIRSELPSDVENIWIRNYSTTDMPIAFCGIASKQDLRSSYDLLDLKVRRPLLRVPGVADVEMFGVEKRRLDVFLRADDLKSHKVRVDQLYSQLGSVTMNQSLGRVVDGQVRYDAVSQSSISSIEQVKSFPVGDRGLALGDVADIVYDTRRPVSGRHINGYDGIGFEIRKSSEANTVETVQLVRAKLDEISQDPALEGITMRVFFDQADQITKSLTALLDAGAVGSILAVLVLIFFVKRLGATLVIAFSIPFCILSAIGVLYFCGFSLNTLTMMGLMLSTGMLVDNAVVVLESIYQKLEKGMDRVTASRVGTQEVLTAVLASTMTSIIIFVPLIFGETTQFSVFFKNAGASIIFALVGSLFASLTLIPLAMARLLRMDVRRRARWQQRIIDLLSPIVLKTGRVLFGKSRPKDLPAGESSDSGRRPTVTERYLRMVSWPLQHRFLVGLVIVPLAVGVSVWVLNTKVPDNTPEANELSSLWIDYEFSENFHYAKIEHDYLRPVEAFLLENQDRFKIDSVMSWYANANANTRVNFRTDSVTLEEMQQIREEIKTGLPVIPGAKIKPGWQEGVTNQDWISTNLHGDDPQVLNALAAEAKRRLMATGQFSSVFTALDDAREEVQIKLNRPLARKYDVLGESLGRFLGIAVRSSRVGSYSTPQGEVEIWVQIRPEDLQDLTDLKSLLVGMGPNGEEIQLAQVADFHVEKTLGRLEREGRRTYTRLDATYIGTKRSEGRETVSKVMNGLDYPRDYGWTYGFWTLRESQDSTTFLFNLLLALFMVYFVMASLFESLAHPFAIILSLPFAAVGVAWFLLLTNTPFNMMAKIGILVLIGVVVNNGIILIDHINNLRRAGLPRSRAILEGCRERLRPIMMTATTTVVGLVPLAWGDGGLFDLKYFPMARTVMGGLIVSTALTLIVLPTYYTLFDDLAVWLKSTWHASEPAKKRQPVDAGVAGD